MTSSWNHHQSVEDLIWLSLPEMEADFWGEVQRSLSWRSLRLLISFSDFKTKTVSTTIQQWKDAKKLRRDRRCFLCRSATKRISSDFSTYKFFFSFIWDTEDTTCYHITVVRSYSVTLCWLVVDRLLPPLADQRLNEWRSSIQPLELSYRCRWAIFPPRKVKFPKQHERCSVPASDV